MCVAIRKEISAGFGLLGMGTATAAPDFDAPVYYSLQELCDFFLPNRIQMEQANDYPDVIVGCTGGGSNFAGIAFPFLGAQLRGGRKVPLKANVDAALAHCSAVDTVISRAPLCLTMLVSTSCSTRSTLSALCASSQGSGGRS